MPVIVLLTYYLLQILSTFIIWAAGTVTVDLYSDSDSKEDEE